ncbi:homeobox-leucine zipper protein HDG11-like [Abrus precatorius]|uniref:Homeobox-leucine zipper protein HDG11-like n=1 Tax=Abrus precatorius TaxID=3816 RepID=A0A8B8K579_ABRPR|nr:homeobox-leucine zipper protein HDG11-like [Abrus precatorius]
MDVSMGAAAGGSGDEHENQNPQKGKKTYHRHTSDQTARLEAIFSECPHPDEGQRRQIAKELGLAPKQVKFWFQNKRTQKKTQGERADNNALRVENERMLKENRLIKEALKTIICPSCGGPPYGDEEHTLKQLRLENTRLKAERENVSKLLAKYLENPMVEPELELATTGSSSSHDPLLKLTVDGACMNVGGSTNVSFPDEDIMFNPVECKISDMEKAMMLRAAMNAKEQLLKLLAANEPLWIKSSTDRRFVLHPENYEELFPRANHFENSKGRVESSKGSRIVRIKAMQLVDMLLDSRKWTNLFPTIITKARTLEVLENGSLENRSGALLLMHGEMHVLSPLVPSREFFIVRYCEQVEAGIWMVADVSVEYMKENNPNLSFWKLPSGCMIHEISNGSCQVFWVEHVELDENVQTHQLYRDLINGSIAYGAERWLMELQRMCERFTSAESEYIPDYDTGVITLPEGRRSMMRLSHRMVKNFCAILNMSNKMDFPQHLAEENSGVRISVRKSRNPGHPISAMFIITAAISFWLPLPSKNLYDFFRDPTNRVKWDALCYGNPVREIARIATGSHPSNYVSIIRLVNPNQNGVAIIQESFIDPLGSYVVYSPINISDIERIINGEDSALVSVLPSGIVISEDEQSIANARASSSGDGDKSTRGSLITVAFQILMCNPAAMNLESVAAVNSLITSTVHNVKDALLSDYHLMF